MRQGMHIYMRIYKLSLPRLKPLYRHVAYVPLLP